MPALRSASSRPKLLITVPTTVPPASRPRACRSSAQIASVWSPSTSRPRSSAKSTRSASPSCVSPTCALRAPHRGADDLGVHRAAAEVDVAPVRLGVEHRDLGAELAQHLRRDLVGRAVGAVDDDAQPGERQLARERALGELDVAPDRVVGAEGLADRVRGRPHVVDPPGGDEVLDLGLERVRELVALAREELDAVVLVGVVRGRDHDPGVGAQAARHEGDARRRQRPDEHDVDPHRADARGQRALEHVAREARVLADEHPVAARAVAEDVRAGAAEPQRRLRGHRLDVGPPAHPVGAEQRSRHRAALLPGPRHGR